MQQLVAVFKQHVIATALTQQVAHEHNTLLSTRVKGAPLAGYGIRTIFGSVQGTPRITHNQNVKLQRALLFQRGLHTEAQWESFTNGTLMALPVHVPNHTLPMWRNMAAKQAANSTAPWTLQCPRCEGIMHFQGKPLKHTSGWPKHRCQHCQVEGRVGAARCTACFAKLSDCECLAYRVQKVLSSRSDRLRRMLMASTPLAVSRTVPDRDDS